MKKVKLLAILLALMSEKAWAPYYYVNISTGNDNYTGTEEFVQSATVGPWRTISKAASVAVAGDEIYVRAGAMEVRMLFLQTVNSGQPD